MESDTYRRRRPVGLVSRGIESNSSLLFYLTVKLYHPFPDGELEYLNVCSVFSEFIAKCAECAGFVAMGRQILDDTGSNLRHTESNFRHAVSNL